MSLEYIPAWPSFCFAISTFWVGDPLGRDLDRRPGLLFCNFYFLDWRSLGARFGPATRVFVLHFLYLGGGRSRPDADRQRAAVRLGANESEHVYYYFTTVGGMLPELI